MQEQDNRARVFEPFEAHPAITYSLPSSPFSLQDLTPEFVGQQLRSQIITPSPRRASHSHQNPNSVEEVFDPAYSLYNYSTSSSTVRPVFNSAPYPKSPSSSSSSSSSPRSISDNYQQLTFSDHQHYPPSELSSEGSISLLSQPRKDQWRVSKSLATMGTGTVKRSISTPNVQQAAAMSSTAGGIQFSTDKRRNKLGYHRTSVACGMHSYLSFFTPVPSL